MKVYKFKVRDYTTVLIGQFKRVNDDWPEEYFYVQRGDGGTYKYDITRVEWSELIYSDEDSENV